MFKKLSLGRIGVHVFLCLGGLLSMFPFYWLVVTATRKSSDFMRFPPTPGNLLMENIRTLFDNIDFMRSFWNTVYVASITTALVVFVCSLAGFTFAKFKFPGKKFLFVLLMSTMMIPSQLSLVPNFIIMQKLGWINDFKAIIVPSIASAFGIFWVRQFTESAIHDDLLNAGRIDGCNDFQLYSKIGFPIITPATSFLAIFTFMGAWNNYLWPMIVMSDSKKYILQVALAQLNGIYKDTNYAMVMAGTLLATIPLVIIFLLFSKKFMEGV
ncbi:MAG: carbohydrate ABC transporter permease, partial [Angelakisella sp.]